MAKKDIIKVIEYTLYAALFGFILYGMYLGTKGQEVFLTFVEEDGLVENLTALGLFITGLIALYRAFEYRKLKKPLWVFFSLCIAVLFIFAAGEEISWGQRIFNIESNEFFIENNKQGETNLHNLIVGGEDLNILIFSNLMFLVLITYFYFSRLLAWKVGFFRKLVINFRVPLPRIYQIVVMSIITGMILTINLVRESELHELSFAFIFLAIFINPAKID